MHAVLKYEVDAGLLSGTKVKADLRLKTKDVRLEVAPKLVNNKCVRGGRLVPVPACPSAPSFWVRCLHGYWVGIPAPRLHRQVWYQHRWLAVGPL